MTAVFAYVPETEAFLDLFPHRFDYIYATYPEPGRSPQWQTERKHPLSDRLLQQASYLYGVRFGYKTHYCLLDIDWGSAYHPDRDPLAIARIKAALEPLGLVRAIHCTSSGSGGLHIYFPFSQAQVCWELAIAVSTVLEQAGFCLKPGQLELFPNVKAADRSSLFNAHRLPMQIGSYLLNEDLQPIWGSSDQFVSRWQIAQQQNLIDRSILKRCLKQTKRRQFRLSGKADKFLNDLNAEIEKGWTGAGQTNRLLGRITMRTYVFHHMLTGNPPLTGALLTEEVVRIARSLPGYHDWCRHRHEIEQRAEEWTRCIEKSHYYHYGSSQIAIPTPPDPQPSWNQKQQSSTRDRIQQIIQSWLNANELPDGITARFQKLTASGIGGGSLYRHRDLWHPNYFGVDAIDRVTQDPEQAIEDHTSENHPAEANAIENCTSTNDININDRVETDRLTEIDQISLDQSGKITLKELTHQLVSWSRDQDKYDRNDYKDQAQKMTSLFPPNDSNPLLSQASSDRLATVLRHSDNNPPAIHLQTPIGISAQPTKLNFGWQLLQNWLRSIGLRSGSEQLILGLVLLVWLRRWWDWLPESFSRARSHKPHSG